MLGHWALSSENRFFAFFDSAEIDLVDDQAVVAGDNEPRCVCLCVCLCDSLLSCVSNCCAFAALLPFQASLNRDFIQSQQQRVQEEKRRLRQFIIMQREAEQRRREASFPVDNAAPASRDEAPAEQPALHLEKVSCVGFT